MEDYVIPLAADNCTPDSVVHDYPIGLSIMPGSKEGWELSNATVTTLHMLDAVPFGEGFEVAYQTIIGWNEDTRSWEQWGRVWDNGATEWGLWNVEFE